MKLHDLPLVSVWNVSALIFSVWSCLHDGCSGAEKASFTCCIFYLLKHKVSKTLVKMSFCFTDLKWIYPHSFSLVIGVYDKTTWEYPELSQKLDPWINLEISHFVACCWILFLHLHFECQSSWKVLRLQSCHLASC